MLSLGSAWDVLNYEVVCLVLGSCWLYHWYAGQLPGTTILLFLKNRLLAHLRCSHSVCVCLHFCFPFEIVPHSAIQGGLELMVILLDQLSKWGL